MPDTVDILAIAAHRDDVEQTCGGTLLKMAQRGYRTAILDLTQGEMGTRGSAASRRAEAMAAALSAPRRPLPPDALQPYTMDHAVDQYCRIIDEVTHG